MSWGRRRRPSRIAQVIVFLALLMVIPLSVEYLRQAEIKKQWLDMDADLQVALATEQALNLDLEARKQYVQTDAYVEEAAREKLRLARPGDVVVIVKREPTPWQAPTAVAEPTAEPTPGSWWAELLGKR